MRDLTRCGRLREMYSSKVSNIRNVDVTLSENMIFTRGYPHLRSSTVGILLRPQPPPEFRTIILQVFRTLDGLQPSILMMLPYDSRDLA
jgi:hypothetical protein